MEATQPLKYCLYARKSSEQDERQAMSIESQIKEMMTMADTEGLNVTDIRRESHSAKQSGQRPEFMQLIEDIRSNKFQGILTWAPDRLSRNAGDLGSLVDLMDANKLQQIRTVGQSFGNNPNEKFLLMILCSQAKLENDNKSINVKRGIRAKCEMGIRPGLAPLGYFNRSFSGVKDAIPDPARADYIKRMFERAAEGWSGRHIKNWLDSAGFTTRSGKLITLSQVFKVLNNPFYYGEFEFGGVIYKGVHEPLVTKELFEAARKQKLVPQKTKWGSKDFPFKRFLTCAGCGSAIVGETKLKHLKDGSLRKHTYYHCSRQVDYSCKEPFVREEKIIEELLRRSHELNIEDASCEPGLVAAIAKFGRMLQCSNPLRSYVAYVLERGSDFERTRLMRNLRADFMLRNGKVVARY